MATSLSVAPKAEAAPNMMSTRTIKTPTLRTPSLRAPSKSPTLKGTVRKSTRKSVLNVEKKTATVKTDENKNKKPVEVLKNASGSSDEGTAETAVVEPSNPVPEPNPEGNKVFSLFPHTCTAKLIEDKTFRMMVTMDGTKFERETEHAMKLNEGSVLVSPSHKIKVTTPACVVELQDGSVVSIDSTEDTTYIRDFHDRWKGHVVVHVDGKNINMMPGTELIVTNESDPEKAWQNAVRHQIKRRGLSKYKIGRDDVTVFRGDFSIPDAMLKSHHFLYLKDHQDQHSRSVLDEITKTAALLHITDHSGPFTFMR